MSGVFRLDLYDFAFCPKMVIFDVEGQFSI